jgi:enoyl-CoA hydratase/carnithine racemase
MLSSTLLSPGVVLLDFNRPEKHNAINAELYRELTHALRTAQADPDTRAVVLSATGKSFCAGNDLADFEKERPAPEDSPVFHFLNALYHMDVPVIAAVQGAAIGIGATMLLQCDVIFAAPAAYIRYPFVDLGIALEGGSSHFLFDWIGRPRAMEILLSSRKVPASEALSLGLISAVEEDPGAAARAFAAGISQKSPSAVRVIKKLARRSLQGVFPQRFVDELGQVDALLLAQRKI